MDDKMLTVDDCFHPESKAEGEAVAFYWLEGSPILPRYRVTILGRTKKNQTRTASFEYSNPLGLKRFAEEAGWEVPSADEIAQLCESAMCSRWITRGLDFVPWRDTDTRADNLAASTTGDKK